MCFYAEQATRGDHPEDIMESARPAVSSSVQPEQSESPGHQPRAGTSIVVESERAVVSSGVQPEQSESPGHQTENVSSAMVETKRFYGGSNAKRPRIAHKLELAITSDGRRCGRQRKAPIRYVETD